MKTLLPHQIETADFLAARAFAGCFSGMGSGKTLSSLAAAAKVRTLAAGYSSLPAPRVLIVAPPIALSMWKREAEDFLLAPAQIVRGTTPKTMTKIDQYAEVLVCSYETATALADVLASWLKGGILICDEAHALKSPDAKRTKRIIGRGGLAEAARHAWMLTGTPSTRYADDYFPFLCRADLPGVKARCGGLSLERFRLKFCVTQQKKFGTSRFAKTVTVAVGSRNLDVLRDWIYGEGLAIRHELADVWKNMPAITRQAYEVEPEFSAEVRALVKEMEKKTIAQIEEMGRKDDPALATIMREIGLGKVKPAAAFIEGLVADRSVEGGILIGCWHTDVIDSVTDLLAQAGCHVGVIDGRTSMAQRDALQAQFNAGHLTALVGQIAAMGVSLNLQQGGNTIVTIEESWSPAIMDQFYARLHRMGQQRPVNVINLRTDTKIEKALVEIAARKTTEHNRVNAQ